MAAIIGEAAYIMKRITIDVKIRHTEEYYHELLVLHGNHSHFLLPRIHILLKTRTQVTYNPLTPPLYFLGEGWYEMIPGPETAYAPIGLHPQSDPTWKCISPASLTNNGIYPVERPAILNTIARSAVGQPIAIQGLSIISFLDENAVAELTRITWNTLW